MPYITPCWEGWTLEIHQNTGWLLRRFLKFCRDLVSKTIFDSNLWLPCLLSKPATIEFLLKHSRIVFWCLPPNLPNPHYPGEIWCCVIAGVQYSSLTPCKTQSWVDAGVRSIFRFEKHFQVHLGLFLFITSFTCWSFFPQHQIFSRYFIAFPSLPGPSRSGGQSMITRLIRESSGPVSRTRAFHMRITEPWPQLSD